MKLVLQSKRWRGLNWTSGSRDGEQGTDTYRQEVSTIKRQQGNNPGGRKKKPCWRLTCKGKARRAGEGMSQKPGVRGWATVPHAGRDPSDMRIHLWQSGISAGWQWVRDPGEGRNRQIFSNEKAREAEGLG